MKIAQLAPNVERVPPDNYGGTELIVHLLTEGLVERGHEVTLFASGDSATGARLVSVIDKPLRNHPQVLLRQWPAFDIQSLLKVREMQSQFDIVHNHMGYQALPYLPQLRCANVSTNHNLVKDYSLPLYRAFKQLPYVAISNAYRRLNHEEELNYVATVYNSLDLEQFAINKTSARSYLLFIGRLCEDKGTAEAIEIAQALNLPLKIAGKVDDADRTYFEERVKPRLNEQIQYIGEVNHASKVDLYQKAIAVLYPIAFEEPFGLVMIEAMACGTPLAAYNRGAVEEVLLDGENGIIAGSRDELIARFPELSKIKPEVCRERVRQFFSKEQMVSNYESVYQSLLNSRRSKAHDKHFAST
ncbi:MAG: glycosyl transferase [Candidatus Melainabacteria bacterium]|nr:MAG: glycosyl transferase [Candidatus Melainabacteria bacterium]